VFPQRSRRHSVQDMTVSGNTGRELMAQGAPLVVRVDPRTIKAVTTAMAITVGVAVAVLLFQPAGHRYTPLQTLVYVGGWLAFLLLCRIGIRRSHVALYADRIEVTLALLPTRRIARADVVARSTKPGRWTPLPVLVLKNGRRVTIPLYLERNKEFSAWLNTLPHRQRRRWFGP
jgi:hypothetical protein